MERLDYGVQYSFVLSQKPVIIGDPRFPGPVLSLTVLYKRTPERDTARDTGQASCASVYKLTAAKVAALKKPGRHSDAATWC
jgi:hypothetical protein